MNRFKPSSWQQDPQDLAKEFCAWEENGTHQEAPQSKPEEFSKQLVRRGVLDAQTGRLTGNSKQKYLSSWTPSGVYQDNYTRTFSHT